MNNKTKLGAVVSQVAGFQIRIILDVNGNPKGLFGIYAGKHLYKDFCSKETAEREAAKLTDNRPSHYPHRKAFEAWKNAGYKHNE